MRRRECSPNTSRRYAKYNQKSSIYPEYSFDVSRQVSGFSNHKKSPADTTKNAGWPSVKFFLIYYNMRYLIWSLVVCVCARKSIRSDLYSYLGSPATTLLVIPRCHHRHVYFSSENERGRYYGDTSRNQEWFHPQSQLAQLFFAWNRYKIVFFVCDNHFEFKGWIQVKSVRLNNLCFNIKNCLCEL